MILAEICVFKCDNCPAVTVCKDMDSWKLFEDFWADGMLNHYCPKCSDLPEIAASILADKKLMLEALKQGSKFESEVLDAKFIN